MSPPSLRSRVLALALATVSLPHAARAQGEEWVSRGPFCARPLDLSAPRQLAAPAYLAVGGRLFRSLDRWAGWTGVGAGLPSSYLSTVAAAPQDPRLVYLSLWERGVFRSTDAGGTWTRVFLGLPDRLVEELVVPSAPAGTVYARAGYSGIFRSRDRGATWRDVSPPEARPTNYLALLAHPLHPQRLVAQTAFGLWRSEDGGDRWRRWVAGLPVDSTGAPNGLNNPAVLPGEPDVAFVASYHTIYRSEAGGPWKRVAAVRTNTFAFLNALVAIPGEGTGTVLLVGQNGDSTTAPGVLRSRNGGKTWRPLPLLGETVYELRYLPETRRVVALTARGAWYSPDLGATWKRTGNGIAAADVLALASGGRGRGTLVAGLGSCPGGLAQSPNGGRNWNLREVRRPGLYYGSQSTDVTAVATAPSQPSRFYAGITDRVLRSDDGGATWTAPELRQAGGAADFAIHPTNPDVVVAATRYGLWRTLDAGHSWTAVLEQYPYDAMLAVAFDPHHPGHLLAASESGGLVHSHDGGTTWEPVLGAELFRATALAFHPGEADVVLAAMGGDDFGVYRSADGGLHWAASNVGLDGYVRELAFSRDGADLVAGGQHGVFHSTDGGLTWRPVAGAPTPARAVAIAPDGTLHVGTDLGVFSSPLAALP